MKNIIMQNSDIVDATKRNHNLSNSSSNKEI